MCSEVECSTVQWGGVVWSGVEWSGVEWSGVEWSAVDPSDVEWSETPWGGVAWGGEGCGGVAFRGIKTPSKRLGWDRSGPRTEQGKAECWQQTHRTGASCDPQFHGMSRPVPCGTRQCKQRWALRAVSTKQRPTRNRPLLTDLGRGALPSGSRPPTSEKGPEMEGRFEGHNLLFGL